MVGKEAAKEGPHKTKQRHGVPGSHQVESIKREGELDGEPEQRVEGAEGWR